jgi:hypothetical protein
MATEAPIEAADEYGDVFDNLDMPVARFTLEEALARRDAFNATVSIGDL